MNVILMMLAILYSDHCEFRGEKTECQGAGEDKEQECGMLLAPNL